MIKISTRTRKDFLIHLGLVSALVIALFLFFFFVYLPFTTNHGESITVPELRKMSVTELEDYLDERGLRYEVSDSTFVASVTPLSILTQYPLPGTQVKQNRKIYVTVAARTAPMLKMPKLTDMTYRSAQMLLRSVGLEMGTLRYVPDLAQNAVLKQLYEGKEILPGQPIAKGSKIDLEVGNGLGVNTFPVPDVTNMPLDEAQFQIVGAGLKVGHIEEITSPDLAPGTVVRQNPEAGNKIRIGDVIDLWVVGPLNASPSPEPANDFE